MSVKKCLIWFLEAARFLLVETRQATITFQIKDCIDLASEFTSLKVIGRTCPFFDTFHFFADFTQHLLVLM